MWITKRTNKKGTRYIYQERFQDKKKGVKMTVSVTLNSRNAHAQKVAAQMLREKFQEKADKGEAQKASRIESLALSTVLQEWQELTDMRIKEATRINHALYIRKILAGLPDGILFKDFTAPMAEKSYSVITTWTNSLLIIASPC